MAALDSCRRLADWATSLEPTTDDLALADRSLADTVAVAVAARDEPLVARVAPILDRCGLWALAGHLLDYDDLHMPSTTHISTVCVPVAVETGGGARAYLAGAGVMARLGSALGWAHYRAGWHATTTAGAVGAAAAASVSLGLEAEATARALALAVPASGGVQRAFGTDAKSVQVALAAQAGLRAAQLAAAGATADTSALDAWLPLVGAGRAGLGDTTETAAVPGGLAVKVYPCCYALQRPIAAVAELRPALLGEAAEPGAGREPQAFGSIERIVVHTPAATVTPLIHHRPVTGLQGKFSLEYAVAAALLDGHPGFAAFTDEGVRRPEAQRLLKLVDRELTGGGEDLLSGTCTVTVHRGDGPPVSTELTLPPGCPDRPPTASEFARKAADCLAGTGSDISTLTWDDAAAWLTAALPGRTGGRAPAAAGRESG